MAPLTFVPSQVELSAQISELIAANHVEEARVLLETAAAREPLGAELARWARALERPRPSSFPVTGPDRSPDYKWLRDHSHEYRGKWVAVLEGALLAQNDTLATLLPEVRRQGVEERVLIHKIE
jgi:hypothetical protein